MLNRFALQVTTPLYVPVRTPRSMTVYSIQKTEIRKHFRILSKTTVLLKIFPLRLELMTK
jgi:hypothetical protein